MSLGFSARDVFDLWDEVADKLSDPDEAARSARVWQLAEGSVPTLPPGTPDWQVALTSFVAATIVRNNLRIESQLRDAGVALPPS